MINTYRQTTKLSQRSYRDEQIRLVVLAISLHLKVAVFQGYTQVAEELATVLSQSEPLEERTRDDDQEMLLLIAYYWHVQKKPELAYEQARIGLILFPDHPSFARIHATLSRTNQQTATKSAKRKGHPQ